MSTDENKKTWIEKIADRFDSLMTKFDMPEDMRIEIEQFVFSVAREQFQSGNRSGISWLRKQAGAKPGQLLMAVDAAPVVA